MNLRREARVWWLNFESMRRPELDACRRLLSPSELERWSRMARKEARLEFLLSRALRRAALASIAPVPPHQWRFGEDARGRPRIVEPAGTGLLCSLSHTHGQVACLVTGIPAAGVDVEGWTLSPLSAGLAKRLFSPSEAEALASLPEAKRRRRFFEYWTLKEAYAKARGLGLGLSLKDSSFRLEEGRIMLGGRAARPARWQFCLRGTSPRHLLAVCALREAGEVAVTFKNGLPLEPGAFPLRLAAPVPGR